jgi:hypothetical protein
MLPLNSIGKVADCGGIEGTLSKCGANHVFALDDAQHLPTPSAHPSSPQLHIAPRPGIFLCVARSQAAKLAAAELSRQYACLLAGCGELATMPDKRYRAGSHRVRKGAQIVGPGVVAHRGPVAGAPYGFGSLGARLDHN